MQTFTKGVPITGAERRILRARISRQYLHGLSIRDLAAETGRSYGFIHRLLQEAEIHFRSRGGANPRRH